MIYNLNIDYENCKHDIDLIDPWHDQGDNESIKIKKESKIFVFVTNEFTKSGEDFPSIW